MKRRHEIERKRLPKIQRDEIKAKSQHYRKSLRIDKRVSVDLERELTKEVIKSVRKTVKRACGNCITACPSLSGSVVCVQMFCQVDFNELRSRATSNKNGL